MRIGLERLPELAIGISGFDPRVDGNPLRGIGWPEMAAVLASVPDEGADLLRAVYLCDAPAMRRTLARLRAVLRLSPELAERMADATMRAYLAMRPCTACKGAGRRRIGGYTRLDGEGGDWTKVRARWITCPTCKGDRCDHIKTSAVQLMMDASAETWETFLAAAFREAYGTLRAWHDVAAEIVTTELAK